MKNTKNPLVSVIITTKNEEKYLERTLLAIKKQTYRPIETVVSDAESTDMTAEVARKCGAKVVVKKSNPAEGRNIGAEKSKGEILAFLDADTILKKDFIERAVNNLRNKDVDITFGIFRSVEKSLMARFTCFIWSDFLPLIPRAFGMKIHAAPSVMIIKRNVFMKASGYNENLNFGDDIEFVKRIGDKVNILWDREMFAKTSMRRFEKGGYTKWYLFWLFQALKILFFSKSKQGEYKIIR